MKVEIYKFGRLGLRKILSYVCLGVIILGIASMIKGPIGSNESLYSRYEAPIWIYALTLIIVCIVSVIYLNTIFSPLKPVGIIEFSSNEIIIRLKDKIHRLSYNQIQELSISFEYHYNKVDPNKNNRRLYFKAESFEKTFDISVDQFQENGIKELVKSIVKTDIVIKRM